MIQLGKGVVKGYAALFNTRLDAVKAAFMTEYRVNVNDWHRQCMDDPRSGPYNTPYVAPYRDCEKRVKGFDSVEELRSDNIEAFLEEWKWARSRMAECFGEDTIECQCLVAQVVV